MATVQVNTIPDFFRVLVRSRLLAPEAVDALHKRWQAVAGARVSLDGFCSWLVANQHLTTYQADLLRRNRGDHFFLNQYRILERVGKGRSAGVYRALDGEGRVVARKVLPPSEAKDPEASARL